MSTISTVGYGEISPTNTIERIYVIFILIIGVTFFTLLSGGLASAMIEYDSKEKKIQRKIVFLNQLRMKYQISDELYRQMWQALRVEKSNAQKQMNEFT